MLLSQFVLKPWTTALGDCLLHPNHAKVLSIRIYLTADKILGAEPLKKKPVGSSGLKDHEDPSLNRTSFFYPTFLNINNVTEIFQTFNQVRSIPMSQGVLVSFQRATHFTLYQNTKSARNQYFTVSNN